MKRTAVVALALLTLAACGSEGGDPKPAAGKRAVELVVEWEKVRNGEADECRSNSCLTFDAVDDNVPSRDGRYVITYRPDGDDEGAHGWAVARRLAAAIGCRAPLSRPVEVLTVECGQT